MLPCFGFNFVYSSTILKGIKDLAHILKMIAKQTIVKNLSVKLWFRVRLTVFVR